VVFCKKKNLRKAETDTNTKTYDMHIQFYIDKDTKFTKTNILQHCTEISNTKNSFKWQPHFTYIFFLLRG
jgi:hypothetical protein